MSRLLLSFMTFAFALGSAVLGGQDLGPTPVAVNTAIVATADTPQAKPAQPARPASPAPAPQPVLPTPPAAPTTPLPVPPPPPPPAPPAPPYKLVNVQIEFTISDQTGSGNPDKKTVTMIAADGTMGRVRSYAGAQSPRTGGPPVPVSLNVDARPRILGGDGVQIELTIEYRPLPASTQSKPEVETSMLNQSMTVILQSGRPLIVSQAADPVTDRKIVVEAKATVLK
jgi:hypothetical protein